jgi:hypothetical protein
VVQPARDQIRRDAGQVERPHLMAQNDCVLRLPGVSPTGWATYSKRGRSGGPPARGL